MQKSDDCHFRYLPDYGGASSPPIHLIGAGRFAAHAGGQYPPTDHPTMYQFSWQQGRRLPEFQVLLLTESGGEFESEATGLLQFDGSVLIVLFPGVWHRYRPLGNRGWVERWLSFSGEIAYNIFDFRVSAAQFALTPLVDADPLAERFDDLLNALHGTTPHSAGLLAFKAFRVIVESALLRQQAIEKHALVLRTQVAAARTSDPVVRKALEIIWSRDGKSSESVGEIARRVSVRRRTLDKRFTDVMGYSVLTEIQNCRMSRAKRLLATTDLPIKQIAFLAGYPTDERMRVAFQKNEEMTPLDFRRENHEAKRCSNFRHCEGRGRGPI
jgi:AraC-like DNA-binding protein